MRSTIGRWVAVAGLAAGGLGFAPEARGAFVWVADQSANVIRRFDSSGAAQGLTLSGGSLSSPWGVAADASGNLYVADGGSNTVKKITTAGVVSTFASGNGLSGPRGLAFDAAGNLYVANSAAAGIVKFDSAGVAQPFTLNTAAASVNNVDDMAFDSAGNLFVAAQGVGRVRKIVISGSTGTAQTWGPASPTGNILGIAIDAADNVYFTAPANLGTSLVKFNAAGVQQTFTLSGVTMTSPGDLAFDTTKQVLLVEQDNGTTVYAVRLGASSGTVSTFATGITNGRGIETDAVLTPEPGAASLLLVGGAGLLLRRRRGRA